MTTKHNRGGRKGLNLQRRIEVKCIQKKKDYSIYETFFFINLMVTTPKNKTKQNGDTQCRKRGNKYGIAPNKNNRQKNKGKEPVEVSWYTPDRGLMFLSPSFSLPLTLKSIKTKQNKT